LPPFNTRRGREMLLRIRVRSDRRTRIMYPGISVCMICVPVSIDQSSNWIGAKPVKRLANSRLRHRKPRVDQQFPVLAGQHRNISAGAIKTLMLRRTGWVSIVALAAASIIVGTIPFFSWSMSPPE
jgi:hypothetical protein